MEKISRGRRRNTETPAEAPALKGARPDIENVSNARRDTYDGAKNKDSPPLTVKSPRAADAKAEIRIPTFSEYAKGQPANLALVDRYMREARLREEIEVLHLNSSRNPKIKSLFSDLKGQWISYQDAQQSGEVDRVASQLDQVAPIMNQINRLLRKENVFPPAAESNNSPPSLRLADRLTADDATDRIKEFNILFNKSDYVYKELRGQSFSRAEDQQSVKKKIGGKGIGPFFLNDKGDKMLAPDKDAHGGGTFKYFKKVDNQWVRQATLDHEGKPFRT